MPSFSFECNTLRVSGQTLPHLLHDKLAVTGSIRRDGVTVMSRHQEWKMMHLLHRCSHTSSDGTRKILTEAELKKCRCSLRDGYVGGFEECGASHLARW